MNPIIELDKHGQAVWLDFLARDFIINGDLEKLIERDGVRGVTSNPSIFEKAIGGTDEYDATIAALLGERDRPVHELFEALAVEDIQNAADVLRPVYDRLEGRDGFVSLEVSPYLALDTEGTIAEARRLWRDVKRDNLMIKVPGTVEGLPAIERLLSEGINVNITLLFAQDRYAEVLEAYLAGLERFIADGGNPARLASVASFFVSRIDTEVDKALEQKIAAANDPATKAKLGALQGKIAIANAKLAYQHYNKVLGSPRWAALAAKGARVQRLLWASTGTKNKAYSDVLYVEELIGRDTINTMPLATLDAFRDHGKLRDSLEEDIAGAERALADLAAAGVSLDAITEKLVEDGVRLFAESADKLYGAVAHKRATLLGSGLDREAASLAPPLAAEVKKLSEEWRAKGRIRALWARDAAVWTGKDEANWLGWLDAPAREQAALAHYQGFASWVKGKGFSDAVVLGMGGSSLGPEVIATTFPQAAGFPRLRILDSTDPAQVRRLERSVDLDKTLFIVSSKSGGTTEPNALMDYFFARAGGKERAGEHFVAVTDPGSSLEKVAKARGFAHVVHGEPTIGGRYSVLSPFGLVPAAAAGVDVIRLLQSAFAMVRSCGPDVPPAENPGVQLGLVLGAAARQGRDKVTLTASAPIADFGAWVEQLVAESTGKNGKALIPLEGETLGSPEVYGEDRLFIDLELAGAADEARARRLAALEAAGHPVVRIRLDDRLQIAQEFFRFEIATAVAGAVMGINPFDQPDVESAKIKTRELTAAFEQSGALPPETPQATEGPLAAFTDAANADALRKAGAGSTIASWLKAHFGRLTKGDYVALLAYLDHDDANRSALHDLRMTIRDARRVATCVGFGPRFLHSTGQAYKGGPNTGVFLQITADPAVDLPVPGQAASFGTIEAAQARGDFDVLTERGRRALRLHIKGDVAVGLTAIAAALRVALLG